MTLWRVVGKSYTNHRRLGLTLQKVILRNLIKPNQLIIRSYLQNFNFAWVWSRYFSVVRSVPGSGEFGKVQERPGMARKGKLKAWQDQDFPEFPPRGMGWWRRFVLVLQKLHSLTKGINMLISSLNSPFKTIVFSFKQSDSMFVNHVNQRC